MTGNLFGLKPKAKPAKKAPVPDQAVQEVIGLWVRLFEAKHREKPLVTGKDGAAVKRLLAHAPRAVVERRLPLYMALDDPYIAGQGHPLSLMLGAWNRLVALDVPERTKVPDASRTDALLRNLKGGR